MCPAPSDRSGPGLPLLVAVVVVIAGAAVYLLRGGEPEAEPEPVPAAAKAPRPEASDAPAPAAPPEAPAPKAEVEPALDLSRPPDSPPPSFPSRSAEIEWCEQRLASARRDLQSQLRARERMPELREKAKQALNPEVNLREWEAANERLERNIARSEHKIEWYEAKLAELREAP